MYISFTRVYCHTPSRVGNGQSMSIIYIYIYIWFFSEMSFPRFDRLVLSDGGPLLIQYISDACVSSRQNDKQFFLYLKTNQRRLRGALLS